MKKKLFVIPLLIGTLALTACAPTESTSDVLYKNDKETYTSTKLLKDTRTTFGGDSLQKTMLYNILVKKYPVDENQVEANYSAVLSSFATEADFLQMIKKSGATKEQYKNAIRYDIAFNAALEDIATPTKKDLKALYKEAKKTYAVSEIIVRNEKKDTYLKEIAQVEKALKAGKTPEEIQATLQKVTTISFTSSEYDAFTELDATKDILKLKKNEYIKKTSGPHTNMTKFYFIKGIKERPYAEIEGLLLSLHRKQLNVTDAAGMLDYFVKKEKMDTNKLYDELFKES